MHPDYNAPHTYEPTDAIHPPVVTYETIHVYGLTTDKKISAIKVLRTIYKMVEGVPMGLKQAKDIVETLMENSGEQIVIRCQSAQAELVRISLHASGFALYAPRTSTVFYIG